MSEESDFVARERTGIRKTATMIQTLLLKEALSEYEVIALGKLLQDILYGH